MALTYEVDDKLKALIPVLEEHAEWYGHVMRRTLYPEDYTSEGQLPLPEIFKNWVQEIKEDNFVEKITLERLEQLHDELHKTADELVNAASESHDKAPIELFDSFVDRYDQFVVQLRRLERDCMQTDSGLDPLTGLRSAQAMQKDLAKEMERRSRRGKPFCLALVKIDNYDKIRALQSDEEHKKILQIITVQIKKCLRSFDDAYRAGDSEFIMSLKHADMAGGSAAVVRLRRYLAEEDIRLVDEERTFSLTMSYCIAEPAPGDDVEGLLRNMRKDMDRYDDDTDMTLEFTDASPLSRYVNLLDDNLSSGT